MRTTLDIDEDVLNTAKELARTRKQSVGRVISEVFRGNFRPRLAIGVRNGFTVIDRGSDAPTLTMEQVNKLRDEA